MNLLYLFNKKLLEKVAALEHEQWISAIHPTLLHMTAHERDTSPNLQRMFRQMDTPYSKLSEKEKESDRVWARKIVEAIYDFSVLSADHTEQRLPQMLTVDYLVSESSRIEDAKGHLIAWGRRDPNADLNPMEALCMIHEEGGEVTREYRNADQERLGRELAGVILRCCHMAGDLKLPLVRHLLEELAYNETRPYRHNRAII
jgi:hypothetical protein